MSAAEPQLAGLCQTIRKNNEASMSARHHTLWADPRMAEAYDLVAEVVRDHSIAEDKLPEVAALLTEINKVDELIAGILHDRRTA